MVEEERKIFRYECKHCGKVIESLYKKQAEINFATHLLTCQDKNKKKKEEK